MANTDIRSPGNLMHFQEESRETGQKCITEITSDKVYRIIEAFLSVTMVF